MKEAEEKGIMSQNEGLTLKPADDEMVELPGVVASALSVSEIGVLFALAAMPVVNKNEERYANRGYADVFNSPEAVEAIKSLKAKGIVTIGTEGGAVQIGLHLESLYK